MSKQDSLVRYDSPLQVFEKNGAAAVPGDKKLVKKAGSKKVPKAPLAPVDPLKAPSQLEDILNSIIPPRHATCDILTKDNCNAIHDVDHHLLITREWTEDGKLWVQKVSSTPATRLEVIALQEQLDQRLKQRKARETGICPVRQELYSQCFNEIIRQVAINCTERGLLLLRVRDEMQITINAYQTLYESAIAWGMRKALESEQGKADMELKVTQLEDEKQELERQVQELKSKCEFIEKRENERRAHEEKKHAEEIAFLKRTNQQLRTQTESILKK